MSLYMLENDEEILWQSRSSSKFQVIVFLISMLVLAVDISLLIIIWEIKNSIGSNLPFMIGYSLFAVLGGGLPSTGIIYAIFMWLAIKYPPITYMATHNRLVDKTEKREYDEYCTFEYSKIDKIEIKPVLFLKDKVALIRIFPKSKSTDPLEWRFQFYKKQGVKVPQLLKWSYHFWYNVDNFTPIVKILEKHQIKLIFKSFFRNSPK